MSFFGARVASGVVALIVGFVIFSGVMAFIDYFCRERRERKRNAESLKRAVRQLTEKETKD